MKLDEGVAEDLGRRLRRIEGQVAGVARMVAEGRDCEDIVTQLAAASRALDRAGFHLMACGIKQCLQAETAGRRGPISIDRLEKLFLALA